MAELHVIEAMLLQAKQDYICGNPGEEDFETAKRWLFSESDRPRSMLWTCDLLGLNPEQIRRQAEHEHHVIQKARRR